MFSIIADEGGSSDCGLVIQDCLKICRNVLNDDTCQRYFFSMYGESIRWLSTFFDPSSLDTVKNRSSLRGDDDDDGSDNLSQSTWFESSDRVNCASLAMSLISAAIAPTSHGDVSSVANNPSLPAAPSPNVKHQNAICSGHANVIDFAGAFLARRGPQILFEHSLLLLDRLSQGNARAASQICDTSIKVDAYQVGKHIPRNIDVPSLSFGWRPLPNDDRRLITILAILAERYIYAYAPAWSSASDLSNSYESANVDGVSKGCIRLIEKLLSSDPAQSDLIMQFTLAPPPPPPEDDFDDTGASPLESPKPFGTIVLNVLADGCVKVFLSGRYSGMMSDQSAQALRAELEAMEKCANIISLVFVYGSSLTRELSTAISTGHIISGHSANGVEAVPSQHLLPFLLSMAGRSARLTGGMGYSLLNSILRMLAVGTSGCKRAATIVSARYFF